MNLINHSNKIIRQKTKSAICFSLILIVASNAQAIILYSGDNSANLIAPDTARTNIFNSVAKICESNGEGMSGSSVYLKGKYLLTAKHVLYKEPPNENVLKEDIKTHITFNGIDLWEIDYDFSLSLIHI